MRLRDRHIAWLAAAALVFTPGCRPAETTGSADRPDLADAPAVVTAPAPAPATAPSAETPFAAQLRALRSDDTVEFRIAQATLARGGREALPELAREAE